MEPELEERPVSGYDTDPGAAPGPLPRLYGWARGLRRANLVSLAINLALLALWAWLYRGVYPYLGIIFTAEEFRTNQIVLVGALILIFVQIRRGELRLRLDDPPQLHLLALGLALASSAVYLLLERYLDVNTFSATFFGLASYGLVGLWMAPLNWRRGLPAALLLVGALPFGEHLQTFVGYPVRVVTARLVRDGLSAFGVHTVGVDTILVFENGISKIDLPCSGIKSLWTGGLFLLAATWIERRRINLRWLLVALIFVFLLLAANTLRVGALVLVGHVMGLLLMAEMLHVPLGVLGFALACAAAAWLLAREGDRQAGQPGVQELRAPALRRPRWLPLVMGAAILVMGAVYTPRPQTAAQASPSLQFPEALHAEPWQLTPQERDWLETSGVQAAERWRFDWRGLQGSMLLVTSTTWRSHHRPEQCFEVYGLQQESAYSHLIAPDFPVRMLELEDSGGLKRLSAVYWLQSEDQITDDYATRIWADLAPERQPWILVTLLFDEPIDPRITDAQALYQTLREVVNAYLAGGSQ